MFEEAHRPLLAPRRFAVRMMAFVVVAICLDTAGLAIGAIGYHYLEDLDWLDASLNAALVLTGNGPFRPPLTREGKLFSILYSMLGVILLAAVLGVLLTPVFHRMMHGSHSRHGAKNEQPPIEAGEHHPGSAGVRT